MNNEIRASDQEITTLFNRLNKEAEEGGYYLNPDTEHTKELVESLIINEKRYKYWACPCRLAEGDKEEDMDIVCPCDYRDADLVEYDACYCGLYVSQNVANGTKRIESIPERRPDRNQRLQFKNKGKNKQTSLFQGDIPIWRCRVCGYLCAREQPPGICPICKVKQDRFEIFITAST
jgi:ferredoxin-thioredoxin reductase catalytic subunit